MPKTIWWFGWSTHFAVIIAILVLSLAQPAFAVNPDEVLSDPVLEQRARKLSTNLRCLVCQNQSIDDSDASLAKDLRILLRQRLVAGDSDESVINYIVSRYGEFVLLKPRLSVQTLVLWSLPIGLLLIGLILGIIKFRRPNVEVAGSNKLSNHENAQITKILGEGD